MKSSRFEEARYVPASESVRQILQFDTAERHPTVFRPDVQLEDHHTVYFRENIEQSTASHRQPGTYLTQNGLIPTGSVLKPHR